MTNQEAISRIEEHMRIHFAAEYPHAVYITEALKMAVEALKAQELPPVNPEKLEERTTKWLDNMTAEERLKEIAAILDDWDGYRTAKGLGMLINEAWAYALYPVKAQEPISPIRTDEEWQCGNCNSVVGWDELQVYGIDEIKETYCHNCGRKVKWE